MMFAKARAAFRRLRADRRGNVLMIFGLSLVPMTVATGMGIDYTRAARLQTKLNTIADAAALAAVTQPMMQRNIYDAAYAASDMFYSQARATTGASFPQAQALQATYTSDAVTGTDGVITVSITTGNGGLSRTATVSYKAFSTNTFGSILGMQTIAIGGTSVTYAKTAPNTDFYVMLDTSGSMAFPATSAGITQLRSLTGGCAFACHSTNDGTAKDKTGKTSDYYGVATSYGIPLRVDEARKATQDLMVLAKDQAQINRATYRAALLTFAAADTRANNSFKKLADITSDLASVSTKAAGAQVSLYYNNNCPTSSFCNGDTDTATTDAFTRANAIMTDPGNGTNSANDKPQSVLLVVTDGMRDESRSGGRPEVAIETSVCNTIKTRGIRIAILYTEYLKSSMDGDGWSQSNVVPYLSQIEPALVSCASDGLYTKVTSDDDISTALGQLFQKAIATGRITR